MTGLTRKGVSKQRETSTSSTEGAELESARGRGATCRFEPTRGAGCGTTQAARERGRRLPRHLVRGCFCTARMSRAFRGTQAMVWLFSTSVENFAVGRGGGGWLEVRRRRTGRRCGRPTMIFAIVGGFEGPLPVRLQPCSS